MIQGHRKIDNVATRTAESRRVKTVQNSQCSKDTATLYCGDLRAARRGRGGGVKSYRSLEACNMVTTTVRAAEAVLSVKTAGCSDKCFASPY
jgi:hypothetical protein